MSFGNDNNFFSFIWMIENYQMNLKRKGESFNSPTFIVKKFSNTKWFLELFPKGDKKSKKGYMSCYLNYSSSSDGPQKIEISYDLLLVENIVTLPKFEKVSSWLFEKKSGHGYLNFKSDFVNPQKKFPEKIYIICYMWMSETDINSFTLSDTKITEVVIPYTSSKPDSMSSESSKEIVSYVNKDIRDLQKKICHFPKNCFARSIFSMERKFLSWAVVDICNTEDKKRSILVMTISDIPDLLVSVHINADNSIQISIRATEMGSVSFLSVCKMSISDVSGKIRYSIEGQHYFDSVDLDAGDLDAGDLDAEDLDSDESESLDSGSEDSDCWNFELKCQNSELEEQQPLELSLCHLHCEITISKGEMVSCIEENSYFDIWCNQDITTDISSAKKLQARMSDIYTSKSFCDVTLQLIDKKFEAHKVILCANSPVFKAMFQSGMEENQTDVINIEDIEADTLNRMLVFMYTESLEPTQFEETVKLYEAADKYQLISLQQKCAALLIANLTLANVCATLCLADVHQDKKLKTIVSQFIFQHVNEILPSEGWKLFLNENTLLANEILQEMCMKLVHI